MATLTLKKPQQVIAAAPQSTPVATAKLPDVIGKFAIFQRSVKGKGMRFTRLHDTQELAAAEAKRLMSESPTVRGYAVMHIVEVVGE